MFRPLPPPPTDDPERAILVVLLLAALTLVPAMLGKLYLFRTLGWPRTRARVIAFGTWAVVMLLVAWRLLG
ncbi:MAG: hypothetical protein EA356_08645 [Geminicoccaceae bacterium]|nr:MAG: hypothetical protein EA356_08645 [Geminicoccaceae bacterium]